MSPNFLPGARLGHYEIKSQLGSGGMGEVYLAQPKEIIAELKLLEKEIAERNSRPPVFSLNPIWDDLRDDPRFRGPDS